MAKLDSRSRAGFHGGMTKLTRLLVLLALAVPLTVIATVAIKAEFAGHAPKMETLSGVKYADGTWKWADAKKGSVKGKVTFSMRRPQQPIVVYLVKLDGEKAGEQGLYTAPATLSVSQKGGVFEPSFAVLVRNQTVKFLNDEEKEISHNVYFLGDIQADFGIFDQGDSREHTFDEAGEVSVHCSIHKRMDGKFYIAPSPAYAVIEADADSFEIKDVPVGTYNLLTWQKQKRFKDFEKKIEVAEGKATDVAVEMAR
jgi:plastocyanin